MGRNVIYGTHTNAKKFRRLRETYVPSHVMRWVKEEGRLMIDFDAAKSPQERLNISAGLCRVRGLILTAIGWPKPPTLRSGIPSVLSGVANHNPMLDLEAEPVVDDPGAPAPSEASEPGSEPAPD